MKIGNPPHCHGPNLESLRAQLLVPSHRLVDPNQSDLEAIQKGLIFCRADIASWGLNGGGPLMEGKTCGKQTCSIPKPWCVEDEVSRHGQRGLDRAGDTVS